MAITAYKASVFHMLDDPTVVGVESSYQYFSAGMLIVEDGHIRHIGQAKDIEAKLSEDTTIVDYSGCLIAPGFIDTHIHYPQLDVVASYGEQLIDWLNKYTFPAEAKFSNAEHAMESAEFFVNELFRHGTTSALVFGTVHKSATDALFTEAYRHNMRIIAGKVLMDRNVPENVADTADSGDKESRELISKWHGKGRLEYAVTPRFAPACSDEQMKRAGQILVDHPGVLMQTHLSENSTEIEWVKELYPDCKDYLDVYQQFGLLTDRSVFAHCIHLGTDEFKRLGNTGAAISFCPTSNLFLGSGLFDLESAENEGINVGLGTDIGAGTSLSLLQTMNEAYKVCHLKGNKLSPFKSFYLATLGGAKALKIDKKVGNLEVGKEADFVVLDPSATPLLERRLKTCTELSEILFVLSMLGDDRTVGQTYIMGKLKHSRQ